MSLPIWFDFQNKMATITPSARSRDECVNISAQLEDRRRGVNKRILLSFFCFVFIYTVFRMKQEYIIQPNCCSLA